MRLDNRLEIRLRSALRRDLEVLAAARGWTLALLVREFLRQGVEHELTHGRRSGRGTEG